jgi:hypothetical protein
MMSSARTGLFATLTALFASVPAIVRACPMCFAGGQQNQDAFLYGSLFLMVVPTATLGGLGYWVYRRLKAIDDGLVQPESDEAALDQQPHQPQQAHQPQPQSSGTAVVLQMPSRQ